MDTITKSMKVWEIKKILRLHGIDMPYMWELALNMVFETLETDTLKVVGFGNSAYFEAVAANPRKPSGRKESLKR